MPMIYLIFGHLIADFLLQPYQLVRWKRKEWQGMLFHSVVHLLINLVILWPFMPNVTVIWGVLTLCAAHFLVDTIKVQIEIKGRRYRTYFLMDQLAHLLIIMFVGVFIGDVGFSSGYIEEYGVIASFLAGVYQNTYIIFGLSIIIFSTYAIEIFAFQGVREREIAKVSSFRLNYRAMLKRGIVFTAIYAIFIIFGVLGVAAHV
jgi:hypothetical protein